MEAALEKFNAFTKSGQDFVDGVFRRRNPIEILKRLQREAFSDIMKLRDRQEKVERILSFYQSSKEGPFQETSTHVRGHLDYLGSLLVLSDVNQQNIDAVDKCGIRTGVASRFIFETKIGEKCSGAVEFVATNATNGDRENCDERPLSLSKLSFTANVNDWFSFVAMPIGARGRDVAIASDSFDQVGEGFTVFSYSGPPLLHLHNGTAIGITVRKSNVIASLTEHVTASQIPHTSSTFGQLLYQFSGGTKLSLLGLHHTPLSLKRLGNFDAFSFPIVLSKQNEVSEAATEVSSSTGIRTSGGSIALMAESKIDGFGKLGGWFEMNKLNPQSVQFGVNLSDDSQDSLGWGMSLSRFMENSENEAHFQAESYLRFNMGNKFCLKPGVVLGTDGKSKIAALMLRSNWSL
ncbi:uncharacterized protein HKW66_Vig0094260 [Vigna angularis]|uniref:Uncharacterized protein n=2 Tax=Phaseolus angularis TaxID=3914 RepID=A0A8T0KKY0_PHAAN|nr:uncharacterized protein LOC108341970 [Vigna angularis]KAG2400720.1 uncharacterized protein HKW66_Vig0094260 [Vigna angularis]BAT77670.1 hypothetical protein VIGAN_02026000 [Vigna angularis var. angularis]